MFASANSGAVAPIARRIVARSLHRRSSHAVPAFAITIDTSLDGHLGCTGIGTPAVRAASPPSSTARGLHSLFASESAAPMRIDCLHLVTNKASLFGLGLLERSRGRALQRAIADRRLHKYGALSSWWWRCGTGSRRGPPFQAWSAHRRLEK
jgi:hypothetical protein